MNIFFISRNPKRCAKYQTDAHVCKMPTETAQVLCTVLNVNGHQSPYASFNPKHPTVIWASKSKSNWLWAQQLGIELCREFTYRYGRVHKTEEIIRTLKCPPELPDLAFTDPTPAMPDEFRSTNSLNSYRRFYFYGKRRMFFKVNGDWRWTKRDLPPFMKRYLIRDKIFKSEAEISKNCLELAKKWNPVLS